jgi:hypothetical protein
LPDHFVTSEHAAFSLHWTLNRLEVDAPFYLAFSHHIQHCTAPQCGVTLSKICRRQKEVSKIIKSGSEWLLKSFLSALCPSSPDATAVSGVKIDALTYRLDLLREHLEELEPLLDVENAKDILFQWATHADALQPQKGKEKGAPCPSITEIGVNMLDLELIDESSRLAELALQYKVCFPQTSSLDLSHSLFVEGQLR